MKAVKLLQNIGLVLLIGLVFAFGVFAQKTKPKQSEKIAQSDNKKDPAETTNSDDKTEEKSEVGEILFYYNNYLKEYRLGANDIISVEVFGQCPDYCISGKIVPPTARISYPLIREGVFVGGKTVEEVAAEITKKLDEYIIEPKVTVTLEKAMSARYAVMGKVGAPGIRVMDRKVSVYEAVLEAGGVTKDGDKKSVVLVRYDEQGRLARQEVNLVDIESGKAEMIYLNPGDQVFVPKKGFGWQTLWDGLEKASIVRLLFGFPF